MGTEEKNASQNGGANVDNYGARMAKDAIRDMDNPEELEESVSQDEIEKDADAFLDECLKNGKNPIRVIKHMIEKRSESCDDCQVGEKRKFFEFVSCVMKKIAVSLAYALCNKHGFSAISALYDFVCSFKKATSDYEKRQCRSIGEDRGDPEDAFNPEWEKVFEYSFSW